MCGVLHRVAVSCRALRCVVVCCSVLQWVAVGCSGLHCVAVCCSFSCIHKHPPTPGASLLGVQGTGLRVEGLVLRVYGLNFMLRGLILGFRLLQCLIHTKKPTKILMRPYLKFRV